MNRIKARSILALMGLLSMSGCVGYQAPYARYSPQAYVPYAAPRPMPFGGYTAAPRPFFGDRERGEHEFREEHGPGRDFRDYGGYRRHERD